MISNNIWNKLATCNNENKKKNVQSIIIKYYNQNKISENRNFHKYIIKD